MHTHYWLNVRYFKKASLVGGREYEGVRDLSVFSYYFKTFQRVDDSKIWMSWKDFQSFLITSINEFRPEPVRDEEDLETFSLFLLLLESLKYMYKKYLDFQSFLITSNVYTVYAYNAAGTQVDVLSVFSYYFVLQA